MTRLKRSWWGEHPAVAVEPRGERVFVHVLDLANPSHACTFELKLPARVEPSGSFRVEIKKRGFHIEWIRVLRYMGRPKQTADTPVDDDLKNDPTWVSMDRNGDGFIEHSEISGSGKGWMLRKYDLNGDHKLDLREFKAMKDARRRR